MDEISEFLLFTVTDGHFEFYSLENSARLFKRGVGALLAEGWSRSHGFGPY